MPTVGGYPVSFTVGLDGPPGPVGPQGPQGPQGTPGSLDAVAKVGDTMTGVLTFNHGDNANSIQVNGTSGGLSIWAYFNYGGNDRGSLLRALNPAGDGYKPLSFEAASYNFINGGPAVFDGAVTLKPLAAATPATNGQMTFEATSDTSLKVKYKGSDGVVRSATLTLA